jgi:NAD(P)-dependent dehydrogenase (short-subunit alcohol dehydrogenase family)
MVARLDGQVALITGGATGIGAAVVDRFLEDGAKVGVLVKDAEQASLVRSRHGEEVVAVVGDVRSHADNVAAVAGTVSAFGKLDVFVGNVGIWDFMVPLADQDPDRLSRVFDEIMGINVKGYFLGAHAAIPELRKTKGSMIFTASTSSFYTGGGGTIYVASKHAILGLIRQLAWELTPDVRVNGVAPGGTRTPLSGSLAGGFAGTRLDELPGLDGLISGLTPLERIAEPSDHAGIYAMLASRRDSSYMTGTVVLSDGGIGIGKRPASSA